MKKLLTFIHLIIVALLFASCEKDAYEPSDVVATPTYRVYCPVYTSYLTNGLYEMYVYRDEPMVAFYGATEYSQCVVETSRNFVDNTDDEAYRFSFDRIVSVAEDGTETLNTYSIVFYKDRTPILDASTGLYKYKESSLTVTDSNGLIITRNDAIAVLERTKYLDKSK